jgi:formate dehydrogenase major subunit
MEAGELDASGRRRPVPVPGSEFALGCDSVIAALGQEVDRGLAGSEGLALTDRGLAADPRTLATNLPGVFAGGDAVLGADLAVRAVAAGRIAAVSIDQYLSGRPVTGPEEQVDPGLGEEPARREALRCLSCGCLKAGGCALRRWATVYQADPYRFLGRRRRFERDTSHPEVVYEPGKCILCDACVRTAAEAGEPLGLSVVGRGFDVSVAVPFGAPLADALRHAARRCADVCPTGAISLREARACDLAGRQGCRS